MILRGKYNGAKMSTEALDLHLIIYTWLGFWASLNELVKINAHELYVRSALFLRRNILNPSQKSCAILSSNLN